MSARDGLEAKYAEAAATVARLVLERGERMKVEQALRDRITELEAAPATVYRAEHSGSGITLGHYSSATAARAHCEARSHREVPDTSLDWIEYEEDGMAELVAVEGGAQFATGYIVTALEIASAYDEEADE